MALHVKALILSTMIALALTPVVRVFALRIGATVVPGERSVHTVPVPHLGGVAIFLGFASSVLLIVRKPGPEIWGCLAGGALSLVLGMVDDFRPLRPVVKLAGQVVVAVVLFFSGIGIEFLTNPYGGMIRIGNLAAPATIFWVVALMNVVNLIDGLDGLAAGTAAIAALTLMFVASQRLQIVVALLAGATAGASLGFLPYNFNPAKIFMGDSGAMFLGCMLAVVSIEGALKSAAAIALVPVIALGLPIFDTAFAIVRRAVNGKSVAAADRSHIHHRLLESGLTQRQTVVLLYMASGLLGLTAMLSTAFDFRTSGPITLLVLAGMIAGARVLGILDIREHRRVNKVR